MWLCFIGLGITLSALRLLGILIISPVTVTNVLTKKKKKWFKEERAHFGSQFTAHSLGQQQELKEAGHTAPVVKK
jgi:ABC-type transport system involved in cytochrome bd biosynthesis fused ATPase/permease subunit